MNQHTTPVVIRNASTEILHVERTSPSRFSEADIQELCFRFPALLPIAEIEPVYSGIVPICKELNTGSGFCDIVYLNELGLPTLVECKLWRNPEARRKMIAQVLDYAKDVAQWDYSQLEMQCLSARGGPERSLSEIMVADYPDLDEPEFVDQVQTNLAKGKFLLLMVGDGIRENMEDLVSFINQYGSLSFTLALIELPVYTLASDRTTIITPRVLAKTVELRREIYTGLSSVAPHRGTPAEVSQAVMTATESEIYSRLAATVGGDNADSVQSFVDLLKRNLHLIAKIGRGKKLSLNLKSEDDYFNYASIQENGEVWFYGIIDKAIELGSSDIGEDYLRMLSELLSGQVDKSTKTWSWSVRRNGKYINVLDYLSAKDQWYKIIEETQKRIMSIRD